MLQTFTNMAKPADQNSNKQQELDVLSQEELLQIKGGTADTTVGLDIVIIEDIINH